MILAFVQSKSNWSQFDMWVSLPKNVFCGVFVTQLCFARLQTYDNAVLCYLASCPSHVQHQRCNKHQRHCVSPYVRVLRNNEASTHMCQLGHVEGKQLHPRTCIHTCGVSCACNSHEALCNLIMAHIRDAIRHHVRHHSHWMVPNARICSGSFINHQSYEGVWVQLND